MAHIIITTRTTLLTEGATCVECGSTWEGFPADFLYFAEGLTSDQAPAGLLPMGGGFWVTCQEVPASDFIRGYCAPCADAAAAADHAAYVDGSWELRNLEDERWIWAA